ncbi:MAG: sugar phosphate isomerase/epimerase family protein, partial [Microthrixaceae bacterium]
PGLCTVTLRSLDPPEVVRLAADAGVEVLEWGGDVHVPPGEVVAAERVRRLTEDAGLAVLSYGSYLFLDDATAGAPAARIDGVLDTAVALGSPWVRVWGGLGVEPDADGADWDAVVAAGRRVAAAATSRHLLLVLEFHGGTPTASAAGAVRLLEAIGSPACLTAWQPPYWDPTDPDRERADLGALAPRLAHLHVYDWEPDGSRHPLERGRDRWVDRVRVALGAGVAVPAGAPRGAFLEFLPGDDPAVLAREAAVLRGVLAAAGGAPT